MIRRAVVAAVVALSSLLLLAASAAALSPAPTVLTGTLGGSTFPARSLVLTAPPGANLTASSLHVTENGHPVSGLSVTRLADDRAGDAGIVLVIDESPSMKGAALADALSAARALAAQRPAGQQLGAIAFAQNPHVILPLTANGATISSALALTPPVLPGTRILPATQAALQMLHASHLAAGAVIVLSDGDDWERGSSVDAQEVVALARRDGTPIMTVALRDNSYRPALLEELSTQTGGTFVPAIARRLPQVFATLAMHLSQRYLVRYVSAVAPGQSASVAASATGVPGRVGAGYTAPVAPALTPLPAFARPRSRSPIPAARSRQAARAVPALSSGGTLDAAAIIAGILVGLAVMLVLRRSFAPPSVESRVRAFVGEAEVPEMPETRQPSLLRRLIEKRRWWPQFVEDVEVARLATGPVAQLRRAALIALVMAILATLAAGSALAGIAILLFAPWLVRAWVARRARRARRTFNDELPGHLQDLAGAMRAGRSIIGALSVVAEAATEPVAGEFERIVTDDGLGRPLELSLQAVGQRMRSIDMEQVALIASLHRRSGSHIADALDRVAEGARDRADLNREMRALTGQARMSSYVLAALPVLLGLGLSVVSPAYEHPMLHTTLGVVLLGFSAVLVLTGWQVMKRIVDVEGVN